MRRNDLSQMTPAEKAIHDAIQEVEKIGADPKLTTVILILTNAKTYLSDFIDGSEGSIHTDSAPPKQGDPVPPDPTHPH